MIMNVHSRSIVNVREWLRMIMNDYENSRTFVRRKVHEGSRTFISRSWTFVSGTFEWPELYKSKTKNMATKSCKKFKFLIILLIGKANVVTELLYYFYNTYEWTFF